MALTLKKNFLVLTISFCIQAFITSCSHTALINNRYLASLKPCAYSANEKIILFGPSKHYFNFSLHRSRIELELFEEILKDPSSLKPDLLPKLEKLIQKLDEFFLFDKQISDSKKLNTLIGRSLVDWIGVEYSQEEIESRDSRGQKMLDRYNIIRSALEKAGAAPSLMEKTLILFSSSPGYYVWLSNSSVRSKVILVPLDSEMLKKKSFDLMEDVEFDKNFMALAAKIDYPEHVKAVNKFLKEIKKYSRISSQLNRAEISLKATII